MEAKRRELRDSEAFSSRGEMFTNMSLWREERGPNSGLSGQVGPGPRLSPPLTPTLQFPHNPFHLFLSLTS